MDKKLQEDLANIAKGWSAAAPIRDRAQIIRMLSEAEATIEAEAVAKEIEMLQAAETEKLYGAGASKSDGPAWAHEVWKLTAQRWAEHLMSAYKMDRTAYVPEGQGRKRALQEFQRITNPETLSQQIAIDDIFRASADPVIGKDSTGLAALIRTERTA